jgi:hypothetical protein
MMDPNKMQRLTQLVQSSSILNAQEKAEWLSLMGLMNDKQLSELEEILKPVASPITAQQASPPQSVPQQSSPPTVSRPAFVSPSPQPQPAPSPRPNPTPSPIKEALIPSLSHISNLPSQMVDPRLVPKPAPQPSGPEQQFASTTKLTPMATAATVQSAVSQRPPQAAPSRTVQTTRSNLVINNLPAPSLQLLSLLDVTALTSDALHHQNRAAFFAAITALAEKQGYFQVLSHIEESPLYQDYLNYGKLMLSGASQDNLPLSQEEFEFVADLLQALKINRV